MRVYGAAVALGGILNARSGVPINVTIPRNDNATVNGVTVTNIPGGNSRGTQRPDAVPGVDPYLNDGVRWLNPAAFTTPQPGTFGNLPRNAVRGPEFVQLDMMFSKISFAHAIVPASRRALHHGNRLKLRSPAASLPNKAAPVYPFTDAQAGTFGYMLGQLNRTSSRYSPTDAGFSQVFVLGIAREEDSILFPHLHSFPISRFVSSWRPSGRD